MDEWKGRNSLFNLVVSLGSQVACQFLPQLTSGLRCTLLLALFIVHRLHWHLSYPRA